MTQYYFYNDAVETAKSLIEKSERDPREMLGSLIEILQRKELISDTDLVNILGIEANALERSPF